MALTSWSFVVFVTVVLCVFNAAPRRLGTSVLLAASLVYCSTHGLAAIALLSALIGLTHFCGRALATRDSTVILSFSVAAVLLPLAYFKSAAWVSESLQLWATGEDAYLPIGLSFLTFHCISYLVDMYRGDVKPGRSIQPLALYIAFFPKLIAGPIERANEFFSQLHIDSRTTYEHLHVGVKIALWGFFCKLVVADNVGSLVDLVFRTPERQSGLTLCIAAALYSFQLYFDFLGYTNIAIGVARCFNISLNPNFARPYGATSLREFWRRWHISLSSWFRDYLYIPLGGSRRYGISRVGQIGTVFILSGLWHGAALTFVVWGSFHAAMFLLEEQLRRRVLYRPSNIISVPLTFTAVTIGWLFFRFGELGTIGAILARIVALDSTIPYFAVSSVFLQANAAVFALILFTALALDCSQRFRESLERVPQSGKQITGELAYVNWLGITLLLFGDSGGRTFMYAGF